MDLGNVDDQVPVSSTGEKRKRASSQSPQAGLHKRHEIAEEHRTSPGTERNDTNIVNINSDGESDESVDLGARPDARPDAGAIDQPTQSRFNNGINPEIHGGYNNNSGHVVAPHALNHRRTDSTSHSVARNGTHEPGLDLGTVHPDDRLIRLEATLLRYFIEEIAPLFDACDPERHFARVVPQRARSCPPLLHAIQAVSCRHIAYLKRYNDSPAGWSWKDLPLPGLNKYTALEYHRRCIKELLTLSGDPEQVVNENLLAAAMILQLYEDVCLEKNAPDDDVRRILTIFVLTQLPAAERFPHSLLELYYDRGSPYTEMKVAGLHRSCLWVAFRRKIYESCVTKQPFTLATSRWESFRSIQPAGDGTWADRLVFLCAEVLEYLYGNRATHLAASTNYDRWRELHQSAENLASTLPLCFAPIYNRDAEREYGAPIPEIWFADSCHAVGIAHLEIAKMLLAMYDPSRPIRGREGAAAAKNLRRATRATVLRICGIALHNPRWPYLFVCAAMAITASGLFFVKKEAAQSALLGILIMAEDKYAWPTGEISKDLKALWEERGARRDARRRIPERSS